jgi:hypothetical protein
MRSSAGTPFGPATAILEGTREMSKPVGKIVDTLIGFRAQRVVPAIAALREADKVDHHPHGYMFKDRLRSKRLWPRWTSSASMSA